MSLDQALHTENRRSWTVGLLPQLMVKMSENLSLISLVGHADADILPSFLNHYRRLGVGKFILALHGDWDPDRQEEVTRHVDVRLWDHVEGEYSERLRLSILNAMAQDLRGEWIIHTDADEFLEIPHATIERTIAALDILGIDCLPAMLVQRTTADGSLPVIDSQQSLQQQFCHYSLTLCEDLGVASPIWKTKFPLMKVTEDCRIRLGNHLPPTGMPAEHAPIRGLVHHFKWRENLHLALSLPRGEDANPEEMRAYAEWIRNHEARLPTSGCRPYDRDVLIQNGLLVKPTRWQLRLGSIRRKAKNLASEADKKQDRLNAQIELLKPSCEASARTERQRALADLGNLRLEPGRICLLTFELAPPHRGGIATAMAALAEQLSAAGHDVHVLLCSPKPVASPELWQEHWESRNVRLRYLPASKAPLGPYGSHFEFCNAISAAVLDIRPDVLHAVDVAGFAAAIAKLKGAGINFANTKLIATAHGSSTWHSRGNEIRWNPAEAAHSFCHDTMMSLADLVCFPSHYMQQWLKSDRVRIRNDVIVPNSLLGTTRSFGVNTERRGRVNELVFFGRIELRKGLVRFSKAITSLLDRGDGNFEVTLLGPLGATVEENDVRALFDNERVAIKLITNLNQVDAVNYLKSRHTLAVVPSIRDNLPYTLYECLENGIPVISSDVGGIAELVAADHRSRILIAGDHEVLVEGLATALRDGWLSARLAFEPSLADAELLAIHAKLVDEARSDRTAADWPENLTRDLTVLAYGRRPISETPTLLTTLNQTSCDRIVENVLVPSSLLEECVADPRDRDFLSIIEERPGEHWQEGINRAVAELDVSYLLFCHAAVVPKDRAFRALARLIGSERFDAVVCDFRARLTDRPHRITGCLQATGGPPEFSASRNLFGAGFFAITKLAFQRLGGFELDDMFDELAHWVLLNRLVAKGGRVGGIPAALATLHVDRAGSDRRPRQRSLGRGFGGAMDRRD